MKYKYTCDCKSIQHRPVMTETTAKNGICIHCGHYAMLTEIKNNRVITHKPKLKEIDGRVSINEDFIYV